MLYIAPSALAVVRLDGCTAGKSKVDIKIVAFCFLIEIEIQISNSKVRIRGAVCFHQLDNDRTVSSQYEQQIPSRLRKRGPQDLATARYKALVRQMDNNRRKDN